MEVVDDSRADQEQEDIINAECHLIPMRDRASDELRDHVLDDEDEPDQPVSLREAPGAGIPRQGTGQAGPARTLENLGKM
jgi:hypothetical protein